jgi:hypothetical protein
MRELSLNMIWELCIEMWEYVVEQMNHPGNTHSVDYWKAKWLENHGFEKADVRLTCFFCHHDALQKDDCGNCPGKLVEEIFDCCANDHRYDQHPTEFLAEVKRLNKIRLKDVT